MNDALLAGSRFRFRRRPGPDHLVGKNRSDTAAGVRGVSAMSSQPFLLNSRPTANIKSIRDLTGKDKHRLARRSRLSVQAVTLQMAAAQLFGDANYAQIRRI